MSLENKNRAELIERALDGQPAEVKARVQAIIIRYNIDVRNEFFLIFVAIGHLLAIVEIAPENWRSLFDEFERKLDEWSEQNLRTLAAIQQQGKETERMSQSFLKLTDSLKHSNSKTSELQTTLISLSKTFNRLNSKLDGIQGESKTVLSKTEALSKKFETTESKLSNLENRVDWTWNINLGLIAVMLVCLGAFAGSVWQQRAISSEQNERLGWLLDKANREECIDGIKPADDPQCQQYFSGGE